MSQESDNAEYVQCERCLQWFDVPRSISTSSLPEHWFCENNSWDPSKAVCPALVSAQSSSLGTSKSETSNGSSSSSAPSFVPEQLRTSAANGRSRSPSPTPFLLPAGLKRPPTLIFRQGASTRAEDIPVEKRYQADVSGEPQDINSTLSSLAETLQATIELVADYQGEEDELFSRINEIIARLEAVSRSALNPKDGDKKALTSVIPNGLLIRLDRKDGQNNPHLFTEETLRGILDCHNRADGAVAHFKELAKRLKAGAPTTS